MAEVVANATTTAYLVLKSICSLFNSKIVGDFLEALVGGVTDEFARVRMVTLKEGLARSAVSISAPIAPLGPGYNDVL